MRKGELLDLLALLTPEKNRGRFVRARAISACPDVRMSAAVEEIDDGCWIRWGKTMQFLKAISDYCDRAILQANRNPSRRLPVLRWILPLSDRCWQRQARRFRWCWLQIPETSIPVSAAGEQKFLVRTELDRGNLAAVWKRAGHKFSRGRVKNTRGVLRLTRSQPAPVLGESPTLNSTSFHFEHGLRG